MTVPDGWHRSGLRPSVVVVAVLGIGGPIAAGAAAGHSELGMLAAIGGLAPVEGGGREVAGRPWRDSILQLIAGSLAFGIGTALGGREGQPGFSVPALAAVAGLLGGISRPAARASTRFIVFLTMAAGMAQQASRAGDPLGAMLLFALGACWAGALHRLLPPLFRILGLESESRPPAPGSEGAPPPWRRRVKRWVRSLGTMPGWQYALRIALCLAAAEALQAVWHAPRATAWAALTVALVVQRGLPESWVRALQRAGGTAVGVALAAALLVWVPSAWTMVVMAGVLAAARPIARQANYAAYAAVMTPLVMLLMDLGRVPSLDILVDRFAATVAGCAIALTLGYLVWPRRNDGVRVGGPPGEVRRAAPDSDAPPL